MTTSEIISVAIAVFSIGYGFWENRKKKRVADYIDENIDALEEVVLLLGRRGKWAKDNIDKLTPFVSRIENEESRVKAVEAVANGRGDSTAAQDLSLAIRGHLNALRNKKRV